MQLFTVDGWSSLQETNKTQLSNHTLSVTNKVLSTNSISELSPFQFFIMASNFLLFFADFMLSDSIKDIAFHSILPLHDSELSPYEVVLTFGSWRRVFVLRSYLISLVIKNSDTMEGLMAFVHSYILTISFSTMVRCLRQPYVDNMKMLHSMFALCFVVTQQFGRVSTLWFKVSGL